MEGGKLDRKRRRLNSQSWQVLLDRFDGAAMTVEEFCVREGLARSSFTRWRSRLRPAALRAATPLAAAQPVADVAKASFVDLGLLGAAAAAAAGGEPAALDLRIDLGGGVSLHLVRR